VVVHHRSNFSIGHGPAVLDAAGDALPHEPLEVRERLCNREAAPGGLQVVPEEGERDLVARLRVGCERGDRLFEPDAMVLDQLTRSPGRILDRVAMAGECDLRRELDRALERNQVVPERVGAARRPEPHRRSDACQERERRP
jgi:hypothetical protein